MLPAMTTLGAAPDPFLGKVLEGRYRITDKIGEGGMALVYRAERLDGGPSVAVKVLSNDLVADPGQKERFEREARALFGLQHPNLLAVHDFGIADDLPFLVMERLEGMNLDKLLEQHPPDSETAVEIARQILTGLAHAHAHGVLHRDIKAENVFIHYPEGRLEAKLLDFGLVKFVDDDRWGAGKQLTTFGEIFGTPAYMSPEQCTGSPVDARSDVYSMGILLYELLTGAWPFMEENKVDMLRAHMLKPVPPLGAARPDVRFRPELDAVVRRAMAKESKDRYADAREMLTSLESVPRPVASVMQGAPRHSAYSQPPPAGGAALGAPPPMAASRRGTSPWAIIAIGVISAAIVAVAVTTALFLLLR
jgi:serine/threonine-protein kinase